MKTTIAALLFSLGLASAALAADKTYQVTGPVLEVSDTAITVQKGKEKWVLGRDKDTKVTGDLKVGSKVTIEYTMKATTVEVKDAKPAKGDKPAAAAAATPAKK
jgi:cytochrome c1